MADGTAEHWRLHSGMRTALLKTHAKAERREAYSTTFFVCAGWLAPQEPHSWGYLC